jgi:hypothetical protein
MPNTEMAGGVPGIRQVQDALRKRENLSPFIKPWRELEPDEQEVWDNIIASRAPDEWLGVDNQLAVELCRLTVQIRHLQFILDAEQHLVMDRFGTLKLHPYAALVQALWSRVLLIQTRIGLASSSAVSETGVRRSERSLDKAAAAIRDIEDDDADGLIPRVGIAAIPTTNNPRQGVAN